MMTIEIIRVVIIIIIIIILTVLVLLLHVVVNNNSTDDDGNLQTLLFVLNCEPSSGPGLGIVSLESATKTLSLQL